MPEDETWRAADSVRLEIRVSPSPDTDVTTAQLTEAIEHMLTEFSAPDHSWIVERLVYSHNITLFYTLPLTAEVGVTRGAAAPTPAMVQEVQERNQQQRDRIRMLNSSVEVGADRDDATLILQGTLPSPPQVEVTGWEQVRPEEE